MATGPSPLRHEQFLAALQSAPSLQVYPHSVTPLGEGTAFLTRRAGRRTLGCLWPANATPPPGFDLAWHPIRVAGQPWSLGLGDPTPAHAAALRLHLPQLASVCVGACLSMGLGDRLGTATPGHIRALRSAPGMRPILAQQSIREMERTARTPQDVIDSATWGALQEGWDAGYGSDADHLKTSADIDACAAVGFRLFTLDPREHVDNAADADDAAALERKLSALPWARLETRLADLRAAYIDKRWDIGMSGRLSCGPEQLARAACKYGRAIAHLVDCYRHLAQTMGERPFEVEVSVDETDTATRPFEHLFIARELARLGVRWVSLAPRFVGRFEKGVDYIGDLMAFELDFAQHAAIARAYGPYKLSLHSGSDKFSIYPIAARLGGGLIHVKTAGTSYLEALRAVARVEPALFRELLAFAIAHYAQDRASYHVSAQLGRMLDPHSLANEQLPAALDHFDTRQALHVTFGSVMTARRDDGSYLLRDDLFATLQQYEEEHYAALDTHLARHMRPFTMN